MSASSLTAANGAVYHPIMESPDYAVGPEDLLEIHFLGIEELHTLARVNAGGEIRLMLVGDVMVSGLTAAEIARSLTQLYEEGDYLKNPQVTVAIKEYSHRKVTVTGAVGKPDHYALIGPRTLLEVLGMAGGLSDKAGDTAHIVRPRAGPQANGVAPAHLIHPRSNHPAVGTDPDPQINSSGTEIIVVDLNRLLLEGEMGLNFPIQNGDSIHVPFARTAHVLGAVAKPGSVLVRDHMTVTKAIAQAGGTHVLLASSRATILRMDKHGQRQSLPVDLASITTGHQEDVALRENDIIFVHESPARRLLFDFKMLLPGSFGFSIPSMF